MRRTAIATADTMIEVLFYVDVDDPLRGDYATLEPIVGPSDGVGKAWNRLATVAKGDLLMMGNDDLRFETRGWDQAILEAIDRSGFGRDGLFVAWANDGSPKAATNCTFPIVSRLWYEVLGYFTPECFHFLWHDTWIRDLGQRLGRLIYVPQALIEHRHFSFGKSMMDNTSKRHRMAPDSSRKRREDETMFCRTAGDRERDALALKECLA